MLKPRKANRYLIKALNYNLVLNMVRLHGPLSRTQLTELSGLSVGAVSQISNALLADNWLIYDGEGDYTGGRRREMLRFNPNAGHAIGVKLMENRMVCVITNLESEILHQSEAEIPYEHSAEAISNGLVELIQAAIHQANIPHDSIKGIGIGLAGVINQQQGIVHYSPYFHWTNIPLADLVKNYLPYPVYLENDVNTLTLAEQIFDIDQSIANFVVVTVGRGIGMGMVFNHQLYQGTLGGVGEIGHLTIDPNGAICSCGKRGCLEALAADPAITRYAEDALEQGRPSQLKTPVTLAGLREAFGNGDGLAQETLQRSGYYLGMGLAILINLIRPPLIVLSGEGLIEDDPRLNGMHEAMHQHTFHGLMEGIEIVIKPTDELTWARGAASLVVSKLLESPLTLDIM